MSSNHVLLIKILATCPNPVYVRNYYETLVAHYKGDCGVDLIFSSDVDFENGKVTKCNLGIACEFRTYISDYNNEYTSFESEGFKLYARSSISNTPLMLANSVGIVDPQYRGPIIGAFRAFDNYTANQGDKLIQIVAFDGKPIQVKLVDELSSTVRGDNGFGSTNV